MELNWQDESWLLDLTNNVRQVGYVYKLFDRNNRLIYIGKTVDLAARMKGHKSEGRIWHLVTRVETCEVPLADMGRIEGQLIHASHPPKNRMCIADCYKVMRESGKSDMPLDGSETASNGLDPRLAVVTPTTFRYGFSQVRGYKTLALLTSNICSMVFSSVR